MTKTNLAKFRLLLSSKECTLCDLIILSCSLLKLWPAVEYSWMFTLLLLLDFSYLKSAACLNQYNKKGQFRLASFIFV